jgi:hypothetical protein
LTPATPSPCSRCKQSGMNGINFFSVSLALGQNKLECQSKELLLEGKAQYGRLPTTTKFRLGAFYIEYIVLQNKLP